MKLIKEFKDGRTAGDEILVVSEELFCKLMQDINIISFQVIKDENEWMNFNLSKNDKMKKSISSVRRIDYIESKKREQKERSYVRTIRKERLAKRNSSLKESYMISLSGCSLNAQRIFWEIYDAKTPVNRNYIFEKCHITPPTGDRAIKELIDCRLITRDGSKKTGHYKILESVGHSNL